MATDKMNPGVQGGSPTAPAVQNAQGTTPPTQQPSKGVGISRRESYVPASMRDIYSQSPFGLMRRMMEDMDQLFADFGLGSSILSPGMGGRIQRGGGELEGGIWSPRVDVVEKEGNLVVRADLPGMKQEDIKVEVLEDMLLLEGERSFEHEEEQGGIWRLERGSGSFRRAIPLPEGIDMQNAEARFENGVLEVILKMPETKSQGRRIEVKGGSGGQVAAGTQKKPVH